MPLLRQQRYIAGIRRKAGGAGSTLRRCRDAAPAHPPPGFEGAAGGARRCQGTLNTFPDRDVIDAMIPGLMPRAIRDGKSIPLDDWKHQLYAHL